MMQLLKFGTVMKHRVTTTCQSHKKKKPLQLEAVNILRSHKPLNSARTQLIQETEWLESICNAKHILLSTNKIFALQLANQLWNKTNNHCPLCMVVSDRFSRLFNFSCHLFESWRNSFLKICQSVPCHKNPSFTSLKGRDSGSTENWY